MYFVELDSKRFRLSYQKNFLMRKRILYMYHIRTLQNPYTSISIYSYYVYMYYFTLWLIFPPKRKGYLKPQSNIESLVLIY